MILINAIFDVKETEFDNFLADINKLIDSSKQEAGCLGYELYQSTTSENRFVMIENWADQAAVEQHNQNPDLIAFAQSVGYYVTAKPVIHVTEVN
ncbi:putative quinol monooxygenase [Exiguobacterium sp. TNDT2]|uniref:putative quinol monooxygenase n=1 Tax=Exiguobacterium sp. TNDT2 TaxID=2233531 RepID=UPI000DEF0029|nr:putative quinol monooxygenase [Exiguobacterium sp. TNDT2]